MQKTKFSSPEIIYLPKINNLALKIHYAFKPVRSVVLSLATIVAVWQLLSLIGLINTDFFPSPFAVATAAIKLYRDGLLVKDLSISLTRAGIGFSIGATLGVLLGLLTSRIHLVRHFGYPLFNILRPIPAIALVPVAIIWFGIGESSKYFVIAYTVFLTVWLSTHHGMEHVPETYIRAARTLGASRRREFIEVIIPAAAQHIFAGLRLGASLAFLSLVAAELTGASSGIGYRLDEARQYFLVDRMFVGLIQLGILGALLDTFFSYLGKRLIHWDKV
jgi:ABC-type nitrate/sulfonate/bicarbonate transport system permease component